MNNSQPPQQFDLYSVLDNFSNISQASLTALSSTMNQTYIPKHQLPYGIEEGQAHGQQHHHQNQLPVQQHHHRQHQHQQQQPQQHHQQQQPHPHHAMHQPIHQHQPQHQHQHAHHQPQQHQHPSAPQSAISHSFYSNPIISQRPSSLYLSSGHPVSPVESSTSTTASRSSSHYESRPSRPDEPGAGRAMNFGGDGRHHGMDHTRYNPDIGGPRRSQMSGGGVGGADYDTGVDLSILSAEQYPDPRYNLPSLQGSTPEAGTAAGKEKGGMRKKRGTASEEGLDASVSGRKAGARENSSKQRGRPRLDTRDETAADRRRTQIRLAQRAYRLRKENTIASLRARVSELESAMDGMQTAFLELHDAAASVVNASESGRLDQVGGDKKPLPVVLRSVTERFLALAKTAAAKGGEGNTTGDEEVEEVESLSGGEDRDKHGFSTKAARSTTPATVASSSKKRSGSSAGRADHAYSPEVQGANRSTLLHEGGGGVEGMSMNRPGGYRSSRGMEQDNVIRASLGYESTFEPYDEGRSMSADAEQASTTTTRSARKPEVIPSSSSAAERGCEMIPAAAARAGTSAAAVDVSKKHEEAGLTRAPLRDLHARLVQSPEVGGSQVVGTGDPLERNISFIAPVMAIGIDFTGIECNGHAQVHQPPGAGLSIGQQHSASLPAVRSGSPQSTQQSKHPRPASPSPTPAPSSSHNKRQRLRSPSPDTTAAYTHATPSYQLPLFYFSHPSLRDHVYNNRWPPYIPIGESTPLTLNLPPPTTFSYLETTFSRRLHRACLEKTYRLLCTAPEEVIKAERCMQYNVQFTTVPAMQHRLSILLKRSTDETFDFDEPAPWTKWVWEKNTKRAKVLAGVWDKKTGYLKPEEVEDLCVQMGILLNKSGVGTHARIVTDINMHPHPPSQVIDDYVDGDTKWTKMALDLGLNIDIEFGFASSGAASHQGSSLRFEDLGDVTNSFSTSPSTGYTTDVDVPQQENTSSRPASHASLGTEISPPPSSPSAIACMQQPRPTAKEIGSVDLTILTAELLMRSVCIGSTPGVKRKDAEEAIKATLMKSKKVH